MAGIRTARIDAGAGMSTADGAAITIGMTPRIWITTPDIWRRTTIIITTSLAITMCITTAIGTTTTFSKP
jgi:hypothetical protein